MPSWILSLFFHFSFWKDEFLYLFLILFLSWSCQKFKPGSRQTAVYFLGVNQQPNRNFLPSAFSHLSKLFRPPLGESWMSPFAWPMGLEAQSGLLIINQTCTLAQRQPQSQSQRKEQRSSYFIYNLLTTEWKLIEAAGSKWLPVCQHQMAAPALTPAGQELFNSFWLSPGLTGGLQVSTTFAFMPALRWCSPTAFGRVASDSEHREHTRTFIYSLYVCVCWMDTVPSYFMQCQVSIQSTCEQLDPT